MTFANGNRSYNFSNSVCSCWAPMVADGAGVIDSERAKVTRSGARDEARACMKCSARLCIVLAMATYVGDPLIYVCEYLGWRDIVQSKRVSKEWYEKMVLKRRTELIDLSTHLMKYTKVKDCIVQGKYVWHTVWEGPCHVWTPSFARLSVVQRGVDIILPVGRLLYTWALELKRHLHLQGSNRFAYGKRCLLPRADNYRALLSCRVQRGRLFFKILRLQPVGCIYKRPRFYKCATLEYG